MQRVASLLPIPGLRRDAFTVHKSTMSEAAAMKNPMAPNTVAHCEYFAKSVREAANAARELAASHEQMAKYASVNRK